MSNKREKYNKLRLDTRNRNKRLYKSIVKNYENKCAICGWSLPTKTPKKTLYQNGCELHHIVSHAECGRNDETNLILLCPNCHKMADVGLHTKEYLLSMRKYGGSLDVESLKESHKALELLRSA